MSEGCRFCYAERVGLRFNGKGQAYEGLIKPPKTPSAHPQWTGKIMLVEKALAEPAKWKEPRMIFVNSMSDTFHKDVPDEYIQRMFQVMRETPQHTYQVLTKRANRMLLLDAEKIIEWPDNVWMGVSVENEKVTHRIDNLRQTNAKTKFLSLEPLIGPLPNLNLDGIDWVIVGGESGTQARMMHTSWAVDIVNQCTDAGVPVFVKQMGTAWCHTYGVKSFKGNDISLFPENLKVREYPTGD